MADRILSADWAGTSLGPAAAWPAPLRAAVALMLAAPQVASVAIGQDRRLLYNDHAARLYGDRHPAALGAPLADTFGSDFLNVAAAYDRVFAGESVHVAGQPLVLDPDGEPEVFDAWLSPVRDDAGAVVAAYMTGLALRSQRRALAVLRGEERERAFVLRLSDTLRPLADPAAIQSAAVRVLGEALDATRAYFVRLDEARAVATVEDEYAPAVAFSLVGEHAYAAFEAVLAPMRRGSPVVMVDVETAADVAAADLPAYVALGLRAFLNVPLIKDGVLTCAMCVVSDRPRAWTPSDVRMVQETTERTWAAVERARAESEVRLGEERMRQFGEATRDILWLRDAGTLRLTHVTPAFETIYGADRAVALAEDGLDAWLAMVLPEDRGHAIACVERARAGESATFGYRIRRPSDGAVRWLRNNVFPIRDDRGRVTLIGGVGHDETALRESERRFRSLVEGMPQLVWRGMGGGAWSWASPQWTAYTGQSCGGSLGWGWLDPVHPDDRALARTVWSQAEARGGFEVEYRIRDRTTGAYRWFKTRATPVRDEQGGIGEWLGTSTDIDDLRTLQERQQVLVAELQHRTRNLMAVVRSIADKTLRTSHDLAGFRSGYHTRLDALGRAQDLLSRVDGDRRATFGELIRTEMAAIDADPARLRLDGPENVALRSSSVQTLALALHELATNAVKYGALGREGGHLSIAWRVVRAAGAEPVLHLEWRETGIGPATDGTDRRGQGRDLIERALPYQLGARTTYDRDEEGVHCTIAVAVSSAAAGDPG